MNLLNLIGVKPKSAKVSFQPVSEWLKARQSELEKLQSKLNRQQKRQQRKLSRWAESATDSGPISPWMRQGLGILGTVLGVIAIGGIGLIGAQRLRNRQAIRQSELKAYPGLDLEKFMGEWFEVAHFENPLKGQTSCSKVSYSFKDKQHIDVMYTYNKQDLVGPAKRQSFELTVPDPNQNSRLIKSHGLFQTPYWILEVGSHYHYAVIATPNKDRLWILSRKPHMEEALYTELVKRYKEMGFATERLVQVPQEEGETVPLSVHLQEMQEQKQAYFKNHAEHDQHRGPQNGSGNHHNSLHADSSPLSGKHNLRHRQSR